MASIQNEIDLIKKALRGEDVRQSICDGLQKINDDNNKFNDIKDTVLVKAREIEDNTNKAQEALDKFEKDLETTQSVIDEFEDTAKQAQRLKEDLDNAFNKVVDATEILEQSKETKESLEKENEKARDFLNSLDLEEERISDLKKQLESFENNNIAETDKRLKELENKLLSLEERRGDVKDLAKQAETILEKLEGIINDSDLIDLVAINNRMTNMENRQESYFNNLNELFSMLI